MFSLFIPICILNLFPFLSTCQAVICQSCAYIEGSYSPHSNPDCLHNPWSGHIPSEKGTACLKAEGIIGGQFFVIRRAIRPPWLEGGGGNVYPYFPTVHESRICERDDRAVGQEVNDPLPLMTIGNTPVDTLTSCLLCNDREQCNGVAGKMMTGVTLIFSMTLAFIL